MAKFTVLPSQLKSAASELLNLNGQFRQKVGSLENAEAQLNSQWDGEANDAFHAAFTRDKSQMDEFYNLIVKYADALNQIADKYDKAEAANQQIASSRTY
ncbi:MAG: WXG100 family type VII secretion target [Porcipelethomonas sp.]